jgi:hypothetical protein
MAPGSDSVVEETHQYRMGDYELSVAAGFGPRILGLRIEGGPQMFAELANDLVLEGHPAGPYRFRGGHRLWAAPEVPELTYAPDEVACRIDRDEQTLTITGPPDAGGLEKSMMIAPVGRSLLVVHQLANRSRGDLEVAPWAITQLRPGGTALIPLGEPRAAGPQADRSLVLWPYTDLADDRVRWLREAVVFSARPGPNWKIGVGPDPGRLGYWLDGHLFVKSITADAGGSYPDRGAVGQVYANDLFCELESIGPIATLAPGAGTVHHETWTVEPCGTAEDGLVRMR